MHGDQHAHNATKLFLATQSSFARPKPGKTIAQASHESLDYWLHVAEISEYCDWMRQELPTIGLPLPDDQTAVLIAVETVHRFRTHQDLQRLPDDLLNELIRASILRQCANRLRHPQSSSHEPEWDHGSLQMTAGTVFQGRSGGALLIRGADGYDYLVRVPRTDRETDLATEVISLEFARLMGLPAPAAKIITIDRELAKQAGIRDSGWPRHISQGGTFVCLGIRLLRTTGFAINPRSKRNHDRGLYGMLVFDVLLLNAVHSIDSPLIHGFGNSTSLYRTRSMCDANWPRFIKASYKDWVALPNRLTEQIDSAPKLQHWVDRAMRVPMNRLWQILFRLPATWYGEHRVLATSVLRKLERRISDLDSSLDYFVNQGYFPAFTRSPDREEPSSGL
jgi:hypothetical protein